MKQKMLVPVLGVCAVCALAGAAVSGVASSSAATRSTAAAATTQTGFGPGGPGGGPGGGRGHGGPGGGPGGGGIHSERVVADSDGEGFVTVTSDRGTLTKLVGSTLTIKEGTADETYDTVEVAAKGTVTVVRNGATSKLSALKVGDHVSVETDGSTTRVFAATAAWETSQRAQRETQRETEQSWPSA